MNQTVEPSKDKYFSENVLSDVNEDIIASMPDDVFAEYPFSWRKRDIIIENFKNCSSNID